MPNTALRLDAPAALPEGWVVYAIGDVHGCDERLAALHGAILADAAKRPALRRVLVHLGDYVDRGPASAAVLERVLAPPPAGFEVVNLRGNHEAMMLDALAPGAPPSALRFWRLNGGDDTLRSYGAAADDPASWSAVPARHLDAIRSMRLLWQAGGYAFAHAGIRPGLPLTAQREGDLLWIREGFVDWTGPLPAVVVHGHTPEARPAIRRHRIGIDTGAVYGGMLTCLILQGDRMDFRFA